MFIWRSCLAILLAASAGHPALGRPAQQSAVCAVMEDAAARFQLEAARLRATRAADAAGVEAAAARYRAERNQVVLAQLSKPDRRFSDWDVRIIRVDARTAQFGSVAVPSVDVVVSIECRTPTVLRAVSLATPELVEQFRMYRPGQVVAVSGFFLVEEEGRPPLQGSTLEAAYEVRFTSIGPPGQAMD